MPGKSIQNKEAAVDERRKKIAVLYCQGVNQWQIAIRLKISRQTVTSDLANIRNQWKAEALIAFDEAKARELAKIDNMESVCWDAWFRSCEPAEVHHKKVKRALKYEKPVSKETPGGKRKVGQPSTPKMVPIEVVNELRKTGQTGNVSFLERVSWCIEMRCKILGLVKDQVINQNLFQINWDDLLNPPERTDADDIEDKVKGILPPPLEVQNGRQHQGDNWTEQKDPQ